MQKNHDAKDKNSNSTYHEYEAQKRLFIQQNPNVTGPEYDSFIRKLASSLGL